MNQLCISWQLLQSNVVLINLLYEGDTFESYDEDEEEIDKQSVENLKNMNVKMRENLKFKDLRPTQITKQSVPEEALEVIEDF